MFVNEVKKISNKDNMSLKDAEVAKRATLIAALSSNHSWKTCKYLNNYCELDKDALVAEFEYATSEGWKRINENDVEEVINCDSNPSFSKHALSMWFYYAISDREREEYSNTFKLMKKELAYGLEPVEKRV